MIIQQKWYNSTHAVELQAHPGETVILMWRGIVIGTGGGSV